MLMDKMTEMVAHMIGIFQTTVEDERMRDDYAKFKAAKAKDPDLNDPATIDVVFKVSYNLEDFTPGLRYAPPVPDAPSGVQNPLNYFGPDFPVYVPPQFVNTVLSPPPQTFQLGPELGLPLLTLDPPSSVVVVTFQSAYLSDNDELRTGDSDLVFVDSSVYLAQLQSFATIAKAIAAPIDGDAVVLGETGAQDAIALHDQIGSVDDTTLSGVSVTVLHGQAAFGLHFNGARVDEAATVADLMPAFFDVEQDEEDVDDEDAPAPATQESGAATMTISDAMDEDNLPDPFEGLDHYTDPFDDIEDGHAVVAGANTLINETLITSVWLDAPVITVMGDVVNLNVISQINVLINHDSGIVGDAMASVTANSAGFTFTSSVPVPADDEVEAATEDDDDGPIFLPSNWAVTKIEGDLISVNMVQQYTFQTDHDVADISFGSTNTYIGLGNNTVINLADIAELGFGYDLIVIGGAMVSINWINQTNVLIDNDTMTFSGTPPLGMGGGDNLLFNGATINGVGLDAHVEMQDHFAAAHDILEAGGTDMGGVASDDVFEGVEILRVLYIEGDFTTINAIDQTNILGDSDQVHLAMENLEASTDLQATVTAGSNALVNVASVNESGVDSTVMVGGDAYDDALLYQADLIDTDADPLGVDMPALATEAVAFLADDMMSPDAGPMEPSIIATTPESTASPDLMQTMLA